MFYILQIYRMGLRNETFAAIFSLGLLSGTADCSGNDIKNSGNDPKLDSTEVLNFLKIPVLDSIKSASDKGNIKEKVEKELSLCLETDGVEMFTNKKVLESIENPNNTILEFPISQLFQQYGERPHPLAVKGIKKDFRALLGSNGIEALNSRIPQKLSQRSEKITSDTQYELGDTVRFSLINKSLQGVFPQYLPDQLKEDGFESFSDTESSLIAKRIEAKKHNLHNENLNKSDFVYDIVVKRLPSGKSALALYRDGELFMATYVSVGLNRRRTKTGQFKIIGKNPYYYSKKYKSPMPNGLNFDEGGFWFHQGNVTGYPASHGCVRQPGIYSLALYSLIKDKKHVDVFIDENLYNIEM